MSKIDIVKIDKSIISRLKLQLSSFKDAASQELKKAFVNLESGVSENLIISLDESNSSAANSAIECNDLKIDAVTRRVTRGEKDISLTPKEFDILWLLASNMGEVFTKEQIYQAVWEDKYMLDSSNIMAFIRKLRKKIEPNPDAPIYIITIWGIGYKFTDKY